MKKPETALKEKIISYLRGIPNVYFDKIQQVSKRGSLDFYMCIAGVFVAVELKSSPRLRPNRLQSYKLEKICNSGGISMVVNPLNVERFFNLIRSASLSGDIKKSYKILKNAIDDNFLTNS